MGILGSPSNVAWMNSQHYKATVTYRRATQSVSVPAILTSQLLQSTDGMGNVKLERTDRDVVILASLLILGGQPTQPKAGDTIEVTLNGTTDRYEVMAINGEAPWRYSDSFKTLFRIHTKFRGVV